MKCLIIAAGRGIRLSGGRTPKPLLVVAGLPLIERTILTAQLAGLRDFCVVTGYEADKVEKFLSDLGRRRDLNITTVRNDQWETRGNGESVLKARNFFSEQFILLMADHVFEEATLAGLMSEPIADGEVILAADFNIKKNNLVDVNDVTKVFVEDGAISDIGKNIVKYNAYDTGMFLCMPAVFDAIEESAKTGDTSLSGGVGILARKKNAKSFDIADHYWMDIDTPEDLKKAEKLLYNTLTKPQDGWVSRWINRKFSTGIFTPLILRFHDNITPNQVSVISSVVGLIGSLSFFLHQAIIGGILVQLASILDGSDGEIARLKKMQSPFGNFLDAVLDRYTDCFILFGMFYYSLTSGATVQLLGSLAKPLILLISGLAISGNVMVSYTSSKSIADFNYRYRGKWIAAGKGRDLRLFLLFLGGVMAFLHPVSVFVALFLVAAISNAIVLKRVLLSWKYASTKNSLIKHNIRAVIFDFDGTVADTMPFLTDLATRLLVENYDISKDKAGRRYLETTGLDFASQIELIFPNHPKNKEVASVFESRKTEGILKRPIFPEVVPALKYFKTRKIRRFICSSTRQEMITEYCKLKNIEGLVDECFGLKPDFEKGKQIEYILRHHGLQPDEVLFVGDSLRDSDFARDQNIQFVGITGLFDRTDFQKKGLLCVCDLTALTRLWDMSKRYLNAIEQLK